MEIAYIIGTIISGLAAVLAWLAKIFWSKEYISAKDEIIKAKDAQIEQLNTQIQHYKDFTPMKIREYFQSVKEQLEEYNESLQNNLEQTRSKLEEKTKELKKLEQSDQIKASNLDQIKEDKEKLEEQINELENELEKLRINEEEFDTIRIPKIDTFVIANALKNFRGLIPLKSREEIDMANWFTEIYEDPAKNVPYESNGGWYQYFENEPYDAREVLSEQFPDSDEKVIDSVVNYLENIAPNWVRKDRME